MRWVSVALAMAAATLGLPARAEAALGPILVTTTHDSTFVGASNCDTPAHDLGLSDVIYDPKGGVDPVYDGGSANIFMASRCGNFVAYVTVSPRDVQPSPTSSGATVYDIRMDLYKLVTGGTTVHCRSASWRRTFLDSAPPPPSPVTFNNFVSACDVTWHTWVTINWGYL